ncbi:MAG: hypothetical protein AAB881_00335 [Patescibacteria group bacterium]
MNPILKYILSLILSMGVVGGSVWYYMDKKFEKQKETYKSQIADLEKEFKALSKPAPDENNQAEKTVNWKTLTDKTYNLSFEYPDTWPDGAATYEAGVADSPQPVNQDSILFGGKSEGNGYYIRGATVTKYSDYPNTSAATLTKMKNVFNNKSAAGAEKLMLPGVNAGILANTAPTYIATDDGKWRGVYYFANIGQAYTSYVSCVVQMTDGTNNIVQFLFSQDSKKAAQYQTGLGENSPFLTYVKALTTASDETVVTNFNDIFQYMAKSLKSL